MNEPFSLDSTTTHCFHIPDSLLQQMTSDQITSWTKTAKRLLTIARQNRNQNQATITAYPKKEIRLKR